jgi:transmembrane sensor
MKSQSNLRGGPLVRIRAEAAAWVALLHSPERNPMIEAGLQRWIAASPQHVAAWELATNVWNDTGSLPRRIPVRDAVRMPMRLRFPRPALATLVLCLIVAAAGLPYLLRPSLNTAVGEQRTLNLDDGTRVELNTDTHLLVRYDRQRRKVILESGEAYFQVAPERRPFVVEAGEQEILALGTAFVVRRDQTGDVSLTVTLIEGRVSVASADSQKALAVDARTTDSATRQPVSLLNPGERLKLRGHTAPKLDSPSLEETTGWMRGLLIFDNTPLREAIAEFNRYNVAKITVASREVGEIPVGGIFRISDARSFAHAVADSYDLRLTSRDRTLTLDRAPPGPVLQRASPLD